MALVVVTNSSVYPSGGEVITVCAARLVPPPGLFSTTTDWPRRSVSHAAMMRATRSVEPPAGKPRIRRTGRVGDLCALARTAAAGSAAAAAATRRNSRRGSFMAVSLEHGGGHRRGRASATRLRSAFIFDFIFDAWARRDIIVAGASGNQRSRAGVVPRWAR